MLVPAAATADASSAQIEPLVSAIADARAHATSLADGAPPKHRSAPTRGETDAFAAIVAADHELNDLMETSPSALPRMVDTEVQADLNTAHDGLAGYARARARGDKRAMRAAAAKAVDALDRADGRLDPHKEYRIMKP
jgi:hypothetical protein